MARRKKKHSPGRQVVISVANSLNRFLHGTSIPVLRWLINWVETIRAVRRSYFKWHGRQPRLLAPQRYTEKIQWRKLFDLNPTFCILSDKLAVRQFIEKRLGPDLLVPLLWSGDQPESIPFDRLEAPYVIKSTHASGHTLFIGADDTIDPAAIQAQVRLWLSICYGSKTGETSYIHVPRRIIIERQIVAHDGSRPVERRFFVFGGQVRMINTVVVEAGRIRNGAFHDPTWQRHNWYFTRPPLDQPFPRPPRLEQMLQAAGRVAAELDHARVDFYDAGEQIWIGEITVYPWSGSAAFHPDEADFLLGSWWEIKKPAQAALRSILRGQRDIPYPICQTPESITPCSVPASLGAS